MCILLPLMYSTALIIPILVSKVINHCENFLIHTGASIHFLNEERFFYLNIFAQRGIRA